jgi:hypothetical protein
VHALTVDAVGFCEDTRAGFGSLLKELADIKHLITTGARVSKPLPANGSPSPGSPTRREIRASNADDHHDREIPVINMPVTSLQN